MNHQQELLEIKELATKMITMIDKLSDRTSIEVLNLSARAKNCLKWKGIRYMGTKRQKTYRAEYQYRVYCRIQD